METLTEQSKQALRNAIEKERKDEEFERSLGRAMRALGLDYEEYIRLIAQVRDESQKRNVSLEEAAKFLADEEEQKKNDS